MSDALDLVVLSPHLDDAVLSCGGRLASTAAGGGRARVVTAFAGDEPETPANPLAAELRAIWELPPGGVLAARRAEDLEACRRLGVEAEHWPFREALYRPPEGPPLYASRESLYGAPAAEEEVLVGELAIAVAALPPAARLLAPLAVGGHVDHRLLRRAAERSGRDVEFYEDFPYVEWKWRALARALGPRRGWEPDVLPLDAGLVERRAHAIEAYASQLPALFRTPARLRKQLRRAVRRAGGERVWRRRSTAPQPAR